MPETSLTSFSRHTIGIIGAGHLGRSIAETLVARGFPRDRLMLSHRGSPATRVTLREAGLEPNIATNEEICRRCSIIFITIRPQAIASLDGLPFPRDGLFVSSMAGVPRSVPRKRWGIDIVRIMPSGPDTIRQQKGIVAIFPGNDLLSGLLSGMGLQVHVLPDEETMHVFTAGVCLPAAILASQAIGRDPDKEIADVVREYPLLSAMYTWAKQVVPPFASGQERDAYIAEMSTAGGITEAIVSTIRAGDTLSAAINAGITRSIEISGA